MEKAAEKKRRWKRAKGENAFRDNGYKPLSTYRLGDSVFWKRYAQTREMTVTTGNKESEIGYHLKCCMDNLMKLIRSKFRN
jgi:hypothetical protein